LLQWVEMTRKDTGLYKNFQPQTYRLTLDANKGRLVIDGRKMGPPSHRLTLHQKGLKIGGATVTRLDKKGETEYRVARINHLPTFEQVRLHTKEVLYPGIYRIALSYELSPEKTQSLKNLKANTPRRDLVPCIDEPEAWAGTSFEIK